MRWTHFDDLRHIDGTNSSGAARSTWYSVGVMQGLRALKAGRITGPVFNGQVGVPAIDHRQQLARELDMHNAHQSFAVRKRVDAAIADGTFGTWRPSTAETAR